jgi:hypothetical protein
MGNICGDHSNPQWPILAVHAILRALFGQGEAFILNLKCLIVQYSTAVFPVMNWISGWQSLRCFVGLWVQKLVGRPVALRALTARHHRETEAGTGNSAASLKTALTESFPPQLFNPFSVLVILSILTPITERNHPLPSLLHHDDQRQPQ